MDDTYLELLHLLREGDDDERLHAARRLAESPPTEEKELAVNALLRLLRNENAALRAAAVAALGALGPAARAAAPALAKLLLHEQDPLFSETVSALGRMGARGMDVAQECLTQALGGPDEELCCAACALGRLGPKGDNVLSESVLEAAREGLRRAVKYRSETGRAAAASALIDLGTTAEEIEALVEPLIPKPIPAEEPPAPPFTRHRSRQRRLTATLVAAMGLMLVVSVGLVAHLAPSYPVAITALVGSACAATLLVVYFGRR